MSFVKLLVASITISLLIVGSRSDGYAGDMSMEIEGLKSKILALETSIEGKVHEIRNKEDSIGRLNDIIQEKRSRIELLENELQSFQGAADTERLAGKADARVSELENQIRKLTSELKAQSETKIALDARAHGSEKKLQELNLRLENLQKTNDEQKQRIRKIQRALEVAEEKLLKAQSEATSKFEDLTKVHASWLPPWLETHISHIQDLVLTLWEVHAKPSILAVVKKAVEKMERLKMWSGPHLDSARTIWIPAAKEQLLTFKTNAEPCLQKLSAITIEVYEISKSNIAPYIVQIQEVVYPYYEEARNSLSLYSDQYVIVSKPYVEKLQTFLKPYTKHATRAYRKLLRRTKVYHRQVQDYIYDQLRKYAVTKKHATKELAWIMASALLALPVFFLYRFLGAVFCTKTRRRSKQNVHVSKPHRRPKRRYADK